MGVFTGSEEGTRAARYPDDIPEAVETGETTRLMAMQREISADKLQTRVGTQLMYSSKVLAKKPSYFYKELGWTGS